MPDIAATRPTSAAPIESTWGQQVHDAVEGIQTGTGTVVFSANVESAALAIVFPRAFAAPPALFITPHSHHYQIAVAQGVAVTATGFSARGRYIPGTAASTSIGFFWVAIGTPA